MPKTQEFANRSIIDEVAALDLPDPEGVVINHSGALAIWGIIEPSEAHDVDAAISWENTKALRQRIGWTVVRKSIAYRADGAPIQLIVTQDESERYDFHRWDFSTLRYEQTGQGRIYLPEMQAGGMQDEKTGIWVASVSHVVSTMKRSGRGKDEARLERIQRSSR